MFKLWPTTLNRDVFRNILSAGSQSAGVSKYPLVYLGRKRKPEPRSNVVEAHLYVTKSIESWGVSTGVEQSITPEEKAFALLQALQQDF